MGPVHEAEHQHLHALWAHQLAHEYDLVLHQHRLRLCKATLRVAPLTGRWGSWDPRRRTITLAVALIADHPWDVVIEILKHEMAHQVVHELFGVDEAHGPSFARACRLLGVLPWAASASGELPRELPSWRLRAVAPAQERLLERVRKLLALAQSHNEHEAGLAMQRVREIYARHNLETAAAATDDVVHLQLCRKRRRVDAVEARIVSLLVQHFFVRAISCMAYDAHDLRSYCATDIVGRRENVLMAEYVYWYLHQQLDSLCAREGGFPCGRVAKTSYRLGVLGGFDATLAQARAQPHAGAAPTAGAAANAAAPGALIGAEQPAVVDYVRHRYPRLTRTAASTARHDAAAYSAGRSEGVHLSLRRAVATEAAAPRRLRGV